MLLQYRGSTHLWHICSYEDTAVRFRTLHPLLLQEDLRSNRSSSLWSWSSLSKSYASAYDWKSSWTESKKFLKNRQLPIFELKLFFSFWQTTEKSANLRFIDCFMRQIVVLLKYTKSKTLGKLENQKEYCQNLEELTATFDFLTERQSWRKKTALVDLWLGSNCLKLIASDNWRQI